MVYVFDFFYCYINFGGYGDGMDIFCKRWWKNWIIVDIIYDVKLVKVCVLDVS